MERTCPVCATVFHIAPSRVAHGRGVHCSRKCQYEANKTKLSKPKVALTCIGCGKAFERQPSTLANKAGAGKFCTRTCRDTNWVGNLTPNYQDGSTTHNYGPHWHSTRRSVLDRDRHVCQHCGVGGELDVHHQVPFRMFGDSEAANHPSNLISLCRPCHRREEAKWRWSKVGDAIIRMTADSYAWSLLRAANDNTKQRLAA